MAQPGVAEVTGPTTQDSVKVEHQPSPAMQPLQAPPQHQAQPQPADQSIAVAVANKRKRDEDAEGGPVTEGDKAPNGTPAPVVNGGVQQLKNTKEEIETFVKFLQKYDLDPSIFTTTIPAPKPDDVHLAKRARSEDSAPASETISEKVSRGEYASIVELSKDVALVARSRVTGSPSPDQVQAIVLLHDQCQKYCKREIAYPQARPIAVSHPAKQTVLTVPYPGRNEKQVILFSSPVPTATASDRTDAFVSRLPPGVKSTVMVGGLSEAELNAANSTTKSLGDTLPAPKNRVPLLPSATKQAPAKPNIKENVLGFQQPKFENSWTKWPNAYPNQPLSVGHYLDYTKATAESPVKTKQRERAQSLAGHKPSTSELEMSEMESLFRTAFSSFSPSRDDSGAVIPSSLASRIWWQQKGQFDFYDLIPARYWPKQDDGDEAVEEGSNVVDKAAEIEIDPALIESIIDEMKDGDVAPAVVGPPPSTTKTAEEQDVEDLLQEVDDLILTLASFQHIRNISKSVTSTNRLAVGEPDMLTNSQLPPPSDEELAIYETLKSLLASIVRSLPPYAVAKLDGDQLNDLLISHRVPVELEEYHGIMAEDEAAAQERLRQEVQQKMQQQQQQQQQQQLQQQQQKMQQQAASASRASAHRAAHTPAPYGTPYHPNNPQFSPHPQSRTPVPPPQYYRSASGHAVPTPQAQAAARPVPAPHPSPSQHHLQPQRAMSQQYRPNGYTAPFAPQLAKTQTPYGHQGMQQYAPNQQRPPQPNPAAYAGAPQHRSPSATFATPYQQAQPYAAQQQVPRGAVPAYANYPNGAVPQRTASPHVPHQPQGYVPNAYPQHQAQPQPQRYGTPVQHAMPPNAHRSPMPRAASLSGTPHMPSAVGTAPGLTGYHTVMPESQQQRMMEQARVRAAARDGTPGAYASPVAGLAGIGLGVAQGVNRSPAPAPARPNMPGTPLQPVPGAAMQRGMLNGGAQGSPSLQSQIPAKVSPVPVPVIPSVQRPPSTQPGQQVDRRQSQTPQPALPPSLPQTDGPGDASDRVQTPQASRA